MSDKLIRISILVSIGLLIIQSLITVLAFYNFPPLAPLLNSQPWGIERLVPSYWVVLILPIFITIFISNNFLSAVFYKKNTLISRILSFNALLFLFLGVIAFIQIIFLIY